MKKSAEYNKPFYVTFIQNEEALDSVDTAAGVEAPGERTSIALLEDIWKECTDAISLDMNEQWKAPY